MEKSQDLILLNRVTGKFIAMLHKSKHYGQCISHFPAVLSVYKSLKLFLANVNNSSQIDRACKSNKWVKFQLPRKDLLNFYSLTLSFPSADEKIINIAFYAIALFVILAVFGVDINALFILLSSILISFAFMIQSASSKYLEVRTTFCPYETSPLSQCH